jgi:pentatricopeptide repeat protein
MQTDWINYVLGAAYAELEEFLGWVQASYLDNLQDPGLRRLARVANLRTDAFLASLRGHEKPKMGFDQRSHLYARGSLPETDGGTKANEGTVGPAPSDVVATDVPMSITTLVSLVQQRKIKDAASACAQVQGCATTTAACNFLLKLCSKEMLGEAAATAIFNYLEQTDEEATDVTTYRHFIENLCQAKNVPRAMATLKQMQVRGYKTCDEDFATIISVCIDLADFSKGIQVVRQAIEAGSMPALELLNALLSTTKTTEETTTAFQAISTAGHEPNKRSYQQLVEAACVCGDSTLTVRALRQMAKRGMVPSEELVTRAVERCATVNVRHCLKILEMCAADSLPLPAREGVLYFLQMCCKDETSQVSASAVQDCLTAMHSLGFTIDPDVKDGFRALRVSCLPY